MDNKFEVLLIIGKLLAQVLCFLFKNFICYEIWNRFIAIKFALPVLTFWEMLILVIFVSLLLNTSKSLFEEKE